MQTVKTASVQIVHSNPKGARTIDHIESAHNKAELAALNDVAAQRLSSEGQGRLGLGLSSAETGETLDDPQ